VKVDEKAVMVLYRTMVRIRTCEESFIDPILNGEIRCPVHMCTGQEAVAAGVCLAPIMAAAQEAAKNWWFWLMVMARMR